MSPHFFSSEKNTFTGTYRDWSLPSLKSLYIVLVVKLINSDVIANRLHSGKSLDKLLGWPQRQLDLSPVNIHHDSVIVRPCRSSHQQPRFTLLGRILSVFTMVLFTRTKNSLVGHIYLGQCALTKLSIAPSAEASRNSGGWMTIG